VEPGFEVGRPVVATAAATAGTVVAVMPAFLVGACGVFLRAELGFGPAALGLAVACFFAATAASSVLGGRAAERIGAGRALRIGAVSSAVVLSSIAVLSQTLGHLVMLLVVAGAASGFSQPAANLALARGALARPALMFGIKQAAIPIATMLAGASVPLVAVTLGWRWAFGMGAVTALAVYVSIPADLALPRPTIPSMRSRDGDASIAPLVALAVAAGFGAAAATALASFLVESAVALGIEESRAGWLLVSGSGAGILTRLTVGWLADRHRGRALYAASSMLAIGSFGYALLAFGSVDLVTAGAMLAYAFGWGWTGLVFFAVVRLNPGAPATATGIVQAGGAVGAAVGPLAFGFMIEMGSFGFAWSVASSSALLSAVLLLVARRWLLRDRDLPRGTG
jgi:MFS family permease